MPTYLKIKTLRGNVSTKGFEGAIECNTLSHNMKRAINTRPGSTQSRETSSLAVSELTLTKPIDQSSPHLLQQVCSAHAIPQAEIHVCQTSTNPSAYLKYILDNVIISSRSVQVSDGLEPVEVLSLNFTKIQESYVPRDSRNKYLTPITAGYDLKKAELI